MPDFANAGNEAHAARGLAAAEEILAAAESSADADDRRALVLQASFLARLAAALLLEPDFPALPEGFQRLLDGDHARSAARHLAHSRGRQYRSYSKKGVDLTRPERTAGVPVAEIDRRWLPKRPPGL